MKVILKNDVEKLGRAGEIMEVSLGFARNHLIPRGHAVAATPAAIKWLEKGKAKREKARAASLARAKELSGKLESVKLSFTRRVGENGKLFGSVGKTDIVKSLKASGYEVDKTAVALEAAIKEVGESEVELRLAPDATAKIKVSVVARA